MSSLPIEQPQPLSQRTEFGAQQSMFAVAETASALVAASAKATVEARYIMALQRPRNWDAVRQNLLRECRRPSFAHNKSALYRKPIGTGVEGLGIRFVEVGLRCMTNVLVESAMIFEDHRKEIHRVTITDLESNVTYPVDVPVTKTVERAKPSDDGTYLSVRRNSFGKLTYTVPATDDDILNKRNAQISKAIRTLGLRIIPGDLQDECETTIRKIREDEAARDPDTERRRIADAFAELGVRVTELTEYVGHGLDTCSPAELVNLRGLYGAIKDGETTWQEAWDNAQQQRTDEKKPEAKAKPNGNGAAQPQSRAQLQQAGPEQAPAANDGMPAPRGRGRPPGARNKPKEEGAPEPAPEQRHAAPSQPQPHSVPQQQDLDGLPADEVGSAGNAEDNLDDFASPGEIQWVLNRLAAADIPPSDAIAAVGLSVPDDLSGLTRDGFLALEDYVRENT